MSPDRPALFGGVFPGPLRTPGPIMSDTVYQGDGPWVVLGQSKDCGILAAPLNDLGAGTKGHYQCRIPGGQLLFAGAKDSKLELNHLWSLPATLAVSSGMDSAAHDHVRRAVQGYYPGRR